MNRVEPMREMRGTAALESVPDLSRAGDIAKVPSLRHDACAIGTVGRASTPVFNASDSLYARRSLRHATCLTELSSCGSSA